VLCVSGSIACENGFQVAYFLVHLLGSGDGVSDLLAEDFAMPEAELLGGGLESGRGHTELAGDCTAGRAGGIGDREVFERLIECGAPGLGVFLFEALEGMAQECLGPAAFEELIGVGVI
jgi:hypothetical protein